MIFGRYYNIRLIKYIVIKNIERYLKILDILNIWINKIWKILNIRSIKIMIVFIDIWKILK